MNTYQSTPDFYKEYIQHYGIKGMKWKRRKAGTNLRDRGYGTSFGNGRLVKKGFVFTHDYDNRSNNVNKGIEAGRERVKKKKRTN
ncbi:MAG: hypothetical protein J6Y02_07330 [Pseudobutyrivibrio sp.]|nr:hypothetical protein [Pseudobutyrivibrio sp.]